MDKQCGPQRFTVAVEHKLSSVDADSWCEYVKSVVSAAVFSYVFAQEHGFVLRKGSRIGPSVCTYFLFPKVLMEFRLNLAMPSYTKAWCILILCFVCGTLKKFETKVVGLCIKKGLS